MAFAYDYFNPDETKKEYATTKTEEEIQEENKEWINKINGRKPKSIKNQRNKEIIRIIKKKR